MADVFISYSHRDQQFALQLVGALVQHEYTTWIDMNDIFPAGKFREDIKAGIEEASAFLFILSPYSIASEECLKELHYAQECGKKLIPLLHHSVDSSRTPQLLRDLDWIAGASFDRLLEKILDALLTDKDDWKQAGRWLRSAKEWDEDHKQNSGLLLHGQELKKAEIWLKRAEQWRLNRSNKRPQPQPLHIQFIRESRHTTNRFLIVRIVVLFLFVSLTARGAFMVLYHDPMLVTTLSDAGQGSLRQAIIAAKPGDTITFDPGLRGTIYLKSDDLKITKDLTIDGPNGGIISINSARFNNKSSRSHDIHVYQNVSATFSNLTLRGDEFVYESLISNEGRLFLKNCTVSGNVTTKVGSASGIYNTGTLILFNSTVSNNVTTHQGRGGGIYNANGGTLYLIKSTVSGNKATESGGGIYNIKCNDTKLCNPGKESTLYLIESTVSGNKAGGLGGGIYSRDGLVYFINSTIYGNTAQNGGGISSDDTAARVEMRNSIIEGNYAHLDPSIAGKLTTYGYNLIQNFSGATFVDPLNKHNTDISGDQFTNLGIDPMLRDNNEPRQLSTQTHALLLSSPALDKIPLHACRITFPGIPFVGTFTTTTDQRDMTRPDHNEQFCDIGAYETQDSF